MTPVEALIETRRALAREEDWCQKQGRKGKARCLSIAMSDVAGDELRAKYKAQHLMFPELKEYHTAQAVIDFNDTHTHQEVLALLEEAIERES